MNLNFKFLAAGLQPAATLKKTFQAEPAAEEESVRPISNLLADISRGPRGIISICIYAVAKAVRYYAYDFVELSIVQYFIQAGFSGS